MHHSFRKGRLPFASWQTKNETGEPAQDYFARLVGEGYQASARVHANEMEINGRNIVLKEILNELLLLPLPEDRKQSLVRWTPVWNGNFHCLAGETLRKRQVSFYNRRFCRACLAEGPYHRSWWDIVDFQICPLHNVPIEQETAAGDRIKWWFPSFDSAPDGEYLPRARPRAEEPDGFEWYVLSRLGYVTGAERPVLDSAPLHEVINACAIVGRLVANPWTTKTPRADPGHCRRGFETFRGSATEVEAAFVRWLEEHVSQGERNRGVQNAYGWFRRAALWPDVDIASRRAFASVGRIGRQNLKIELPHQEFTIKEAAGEFGADVRGLRRLAQQAGLVPKDATAASRAFLSRERVDELHAVARDLISVREAASRLGCRQQCVRKLAKSGTIKGYTNTRLFGAAGHGLAFRGSEIDVFAQRIREVACTDGAGQVHRIGYLARQIGWTDAQIVEAVMIGTMSVCRIDRRRKGISAWQFEAMAHKKKPFRRQVAELEIRRIEAAELMGYQPRVVKVLVEANLIKTRKGEDGREYLDRGSFNAFHAKYVNAKLYLERLGCREDQLGARLQELGIRRRHARLPTRNEAYIVERKSMERAIGSLANADDDPPIWHQFRKELASVCPSFVLPTSMSGRDVKAYTATRVTFVELLRDGMDLIVRKTFRKAAHREWDVFVANQWQIREEWSVFTWSKKTARESVTAEFRISTDWDVEAAAVALRSLYMHYKNPRKLTKS